MPDKKLTDNEIKKALECCSKSSHFGECFENECPMVSEKGCAVGKETLYPYALDLINRLQAENSNLTSSLTSLQNDLTSAKAENEQLTKDKESLAYSLANAVGQKMTAKAEAYKEFADLSIKKICEQVTAPTPSESYIVEKCNQVIYNLLKELTNEQPPNDVKCIDCEYLEFDVPYGICSKAYKGIVHPNDCCGKGKLKGDDK